MKFNHTMYKIKNYLTHDENDLDYLVSLSDKLNNLIKENFGEIISCSYFYQVENVFIAYDDEKIIGCVCKY